ncbi:bifunctional glyoxylate/hydroxypyruvate reductase B [Paenibacillus faecis]|uniref:2-hydroxyacid dehydrogenase n=1 Tax=Paenibacillus faecis TaxID=862114 RepID=UPI001B1D9F55|nr:D-glycerate dehydrogenase [Paenibacillus faecis]GIO84375.1 bifunctional glyoxylate/hydroxypyruvate reductase B [Paenibacillus faecis]
MKPTIFVARPVPEEAEAYLREHCLVDKWEGDGPVPRDRLLERLGNAEGLLTSGGKIDAELLDHAPRLRAVSNISVGYNNFDLAAMKARGIIGTNTPEVLNDTVADLIMGLILSAARRIPELDRYVKEGRWRRGDDEVLFGLDVHHKKLGIVGMGGIGEAVARRGKFGFGMSVLYHNRHRKPEAEAALDAAYLTLPELLREADFIVLMTPLTSETRGLIGAAEFALMKETAIFINASRGATVDESALVEALKSGQIYGAGLDVFEHEPVASDHPLLTMPNVVTLPHIGSATEHTRNQMAMIAAQNLVLALKGHTPPNVVKELK